MPSPDQIMGVVVATLLALAVGMVALSFWAKRKSAATLQQAQEQAHA